jgi:hypothetical protein
MLLVVAPVYLMNMCSSDYWLAGSRLNKSMKVTLMHACSEDDKMRIVVTDTFVYHALVVGRD